MSRDNGRTPAALERLDKQSHSHGPREGEEGVEWDGTTRREGEDGGPLAGKNGVTRPRETRIEEAP
jgi:hypothetical protein